MTLARCRCCRNFRSPSREFPRRPPVIFFEHVSLVPKYFSNTLSCNMWLFHKYSPQEWEKWLESLPPDGFNRFSKTEWISWHRAMSEAAGAVTRATTAKWWRDKEPSGTGAMSVLANKEPRARSSSSIRSSSASRGSSHSVSGPTSRGLRHLRMNHLRKGYLHKVAN